MSTSTRLNAQAHHGRKVIVPAIAWEMAMTNLILNVVTTLGRFESPEQAILFGMTGTIRFGKIHHADILDCVSHAGFFRRLDATEISHLLSTRSLTFDINRESHRLSIVRIGGEDFECDVVDSVLTIATGRRFR
jgi:hypothetical protein